MKAEFIVKVEIPEDCTKTDVQDYIREAVKSWRGSLNPEDPIFDLDCNSVTVKSIPKLIETKPACCPKINITTFAGITHFKGSGL